MKISNLLSFINLFKYILIIFIYFIKNPKSANIVKKIFNNMYYICKVNILL